MSKRAPASIRQRIAQANKRRIREGRMWYQRSSLGLRGYRVNPVRFDIRVDAQPLLSELGRAMEAVEAIRKGFEEALFRPPLEPIKIPPRDHTADSIRYMLSSMGGVTMGPFKGICTKLETV